MSISNNELLKILDYAKAALNGCSNGANAIHMPEAIARHAFQIGEAMLNQENLLRKSLGIHQNLSSNETELAIEKEDDDLGA